MAPRSHGRGPKCSYAEGVRLVLLALVTACWSGSQPAPASPPPQSPEPVAPPSAYRARPPRNSCQLTIDAMAEKLRPELAKTGIPEATIDELIEATVTSCREMGWSPELLSCYDGVGDASELNSCNSLMTAEQSEDVSRRMMEVVSWMGQVTPPPPPP